MPIFLRIGTKIIGGTFIILLGIFLLTPKVGEKETKISYDRISDDLNTDYTKSTNEQTNSKIQNSSITKSIYSKLFGEQKDTYIIQQIPYIVSNAITPTHGVSDDFEYDSNNYKRLCKQYEEICSVTYFNGDYTIKEKIIYQSIIIYVIDKLDQYLKSKNKINEKLTSIRLNKSGGNRRGFAGHQTVNIYTQSINTNKEFFEVVTHELGHIIDLGILEGDSYTKSKDYTEFGKEAFSLNDPSIIFYSYDWSNEFKRKKNASFKDFTSGYGLSDPFEDFAECVNMYMNHNKVFKKMAQNNYILSQKYEYLNKLFGGKFMLNDSKGTVKLENDTTRRPWDTTRIN